MKKLSLLSLVLALFCTTAFGSVQVYNSSGTELGHFSKIACGTNVTCAKTSGKLNISVQAGLLQSQVAATTTTATSSQCGATFINTSSAHVITLPEASTVLGCRYTFVCGDASDFDINPADGTDQILSVSTTNGTTAVVTLAPSAGDAIRCTDAGGSITLEAVGANAWAQVAGGNGIWTDVN